VNEHPLQQIWARAWACLVVSPLAFLLGGGLILHGLRENFGDEPRVWLVVFLSVAGAGFFALGGTTWARALALIVRARRSTVSG
jgi:hypothetical protein